MLLREEIHLLLLRLRREIHPADVTPAPVAVWGTPVVAAKPFFSAPVGLSVAGDSPAAPVLVVAGALVPEVSSEANIDATTSMTEQSDMSQQMMEEDMSDDDLLKIYQKRKNIESEKMKNKVKKTSSQMSTKSESDFLLTYLDKAFLEQTKGARLRVGEVFPDLQLFINSAIPLTRKGYGEEVLTEQEIYRLKKLILKVRAQIINDEVDC